MAPLQRSGALLLCACLAACLAAAAGKRGLAQSSSSSGSSSSGTYDPVKIECDAAEKLCYKYNCNGQIEFTCDSEGNSKCACVSGGLASCFPGSASVATRGGPKPLAQLALGEEVLAVDLASGALQWSPVYMFTSRRPQQAAQFFRVATDAALNLTVTPGHYLFAWSGEGALGAAEAALARPASWPYVLPAQLRVGDVVPVATADWSGSRRLVAARVTAVERVQGTGVFMPHTLTGAIVVDGVVASELTSFVPPALAGSYIQRGLVAGLRLALKLLPPRTVEAAVRGASGWAHGVADAAVSSQVLMSS